MVEVLPGLAAPIGATLTPEGVNFSVYSRTATAIELLLFDHADDPAPAQVIRLEGDDHHTYHYWHALLKGVAAGQLYGYRAYGPDQPDQGLRFDPAEGAARSIRPLRDGWADTRGASGGRPSWRQLRAGDEGRRRRSGRLRLGGRHADPAFIRRCGSSTRRMCVGSRAIPTLASHQRCAGPTPD